MGWLFKNQAYPITTYFKRYWQIGKTQRKVTKQTQCWEICEIISKQPEFFLETEE